MFSIIGIFFYKYAISMRIIAAFIFIFSILTACQQNPPHQDSGTSSNSSQHTSADGQALFKKNCALCHGAKGNLGINGAKDLTSSNLNAAERIAIITNGKNAMTPFRSLLTPEEIEAVAAYTETLKSK